MPNVKSIINKHKTDLDPPTITSERTCNCINKEKCPLQDKCYGKYLENTSHITLTPKAAPCV